MTGQFTLKLSEI